MQVPQQLRVSQGPDDAIRVIAAAVIRDGDRILVWHDHDPATGEVSRAAELANQKTEAAVAELVEGRATEKAQELYDARLRAETEAVKAELRIDASDVASPGGQPSPVELAEQERARLERERIERELRVDP